MIRVLFIVLCAASLAACASQQPLTIKNDWRTGTDQTPYRSLAPAIVCDDCRY